MKETTKHIYVPSFEEWFHVNSRGYRDRGEEPYVLDKAKEVYDDLLNSEFSFPYWNDEEKTKC